MIELTARARALLDDRGDAVLVFDWHSLALCCASAGEITLSALPRTRLTRRHRQLTADPAQRVYAASNAYPHLAGRRVVVDGRRRFGITTFTSDLPADFGLRVSLGRDLPDPPAPPPATLQPHQQSSERGER